MPYEPYVWVDNVDAVDAEKMNMHEAAIDLAVQTAEDAYANSGPGPQGPEGPQGPQGIQGPPGPEGTGLEITGTVPTEGDLPATATDPNEAWLVTGTGHVWFWDETAEPPGWEDGGALQGAPGPAGPQGPTGAAGAAGVGVPVGGLDGQVLTKTAPTDFATAWEDPPAGGGSADLVYNGAWVPGSYEDGDIVVHQGIEWMAVRPTTATPDPAPWGVATSPQIPYGTSLPVSPVNGQEAILVDSLTAPTYTWRFRYNAGASGAYKWEYIGGTSVQSKISTDQTIASAGTWQDLATVGPSFVVPRAGDYEVQAGTQLLLSVAGAGWAGVTIGAGNPVIYGMTPVVADQAVATRTPVERMLGIAASGEIRVRYYTPASAGLHYINRWLSIVPVRVA